MTLHWWMHWFWITAVTPVIFSLLLMVPVSLAAPSSSPFFEEHDEFISTSIPDQTPNKFHSDSSLYVALVQNQSPPTYVEDDIDDTPSGIFPFPTEIHHDLSSSVDPLRHDDVVFHLPSSPSTDEDHHEITPAVPETHHTLDDTHIELTPEDSEETKMFARDIAQASRGSKAIGREYINPSTPIPQSNHNPFLDVVLSETQTLSPSEDPIDKQNSVSKSESEHVSSTIPPPPIKSTDVSEEQEVEHIQEKETTNTLPSSSVLPSLAPPDWVPSFSSEEESAEEAEAEDNVRPNASLAEEETPVDADGTEDSEAVTKGRMTAEQGLDAPSIVGIVLGLVSLLSIVGGAVGFVLYRRRFLNKPQTLNDKCSNADSSGYIDDTLRDNSEEMYSLDNDSFLNSLEAMTIQNYWTDSVKHTKL